MSSLPWAGLQDPVHDAQQAFRIALDALARPARPQLAGRLIPRLPLGAAMSHLLLALADEDTPVWWQQADDALRYWLRFHTGAAATDDPAAATFAVVTDPARMPPLECFRTGSAGAPDQSCTLLIEVPALRGGTELHAHGPGIQHRETLSLAGLPDAFWPQWQASHAGFPQGVDLFFTCGAQLLALPRSTRVGPLETT
ncbi:MAG: phnH [Ramlibacter sp.]|uniref:phosphonate C-P lyase system protein PhnH n=1 Tax=Ramlibacter sp. TaxID=1917967 RepID=UPI00262149EB|nr:phosphonate C-P lyase system protein PhnH [Ramlibacter sp.]MDB5749984.1 phnH [Ramlibacter sp.]